jgi:Domain of unknown function (DUF6748)
MRPLFMLPVLAMLFASCGDDELAPLPAQELFTPKSASLAPNEPMPASQLPKLPPPDYYTIERDYRMCRFPLCGGFFLAAVDRSQTLCGNGVAAERCYVATLETHGIDESALLATIGDGRALVHGRIQPRNDEMTEPYFTLATDDAWYAIGVPDAAAHSYLARYGCGLTLTPLAGGHTFNVMAVDFSTLKALPKEIAHAEALLRDGGLIVSGHFDDESIAVHLYVTRVWFQF